MSKLYFILGMSLLVSVFFVQDPVEKNNFLYAGLWSLSMSKMCEISEALERARRR